MCSLVLFKVVLTVEESAAKAGWGWGIRLSGLAGSEPSVIRFSKRGGVIWWGGGYCIWGGGGIYTINHYSLEPRETVHARFNRDQGFSQFN